MSAPALDAIGSQAQTWSYAATKAQMLPWPWVAAQAMRAPEAAWPHEVAQPSDTNTDSGV